MSVANANERRIVIVGKTGNGKSSLGNNLLGKKTFDVADSFKSVTECCRFETMTENEYDIKIVDTPGLFRPTDEKSMATQALEILESLNVCKNPHAFLLVIRNDCRLSQEDLFTKEALEIIFGSQFLQHTIVVITHVDSSITPEDFKDKWNKYEKLASLIESCDTRVVQIDNTKFNEGNRADILRNVEKVLESGNESYSNAFQYCSKTILEKLVKSGTYDAKKAHEQVACIACGIDAIYLQITVTSTTATVQLF